MMKPAGCLAVVPAGLIGLAGLTDMAPSSPKSLLAVAELLGWAMICTMVSLVLARLFVAAIQSGERRIVSALLAIALTAAITWLPYYIGTAAPLYQKRIFTTLLQVVGSIAPIGLLVLAWLRSRRAPVR